MAWERAAFTMRLCLLLPWLVFVAACGGADGSGPAPWPKQTVTGIVVNQGQPVAGASVYLYCSVGSGQANLFFFTTTDSQGAYRKSVDNAVAPCVVYSDVVGKTALFSYVKAFVAGAATAHVTPVADATLSLIMGTGFPASFQKDITNSLAKLAALLQAGADTKAWDAMREKLLHGTEFTDVPNVSAMVGDPVSGTLTTADSTAPGYFGLLKNLYKHKLDSNWLLGYASDQAATITGSVVLNGVIVPHTDVHLTCTNPTGLRDFYVTTDSQGVFSAYVPKTYTLCFLDAYDNTHADDSGTYWFSYTAITAGSGTITAHITALTDTLLALLLDGHDVSSILDQDGLALLQAQLDQGNDVSIWKTVRQNLIDGPSFKAPEDVNAMDADPMTSALNTSTSPVQAGHFRLLQKLGDASRENGDASREKLRRIATGS